MTPDKPMNLRSLLLPFGIEAPAIELQDMVLDSREVAIHKLFVAVAGHKLDGRNFIPQAISLGAKAILAETADEAAHGQMEMREQSLIVQFYRLSERLSALAAEFFQHPASGLQVAAVTGTNGKTSTVQLIAQMSELLGHRAGSIGTLGAGLLGNMQEVGNTTPDAISMHRLLREMSHQGGQVVALEASSHALVQHRIASLKTDVALFTNLTRDHLDYHGDMNRYAAAKRLLLNQPGLKSVVLNQQDEESLNWLALAKERKELIFYGLETPRFNTLPYLVADRVEYLPEGTRIHLSSHLGEAELHSSLLGQFNVLNLLGAMAVQLCLGHGFERITRAAQLVKPVPGRLEVFHSEGLPTLVVDYAHTPDALEQALKALRDHARGRVFVIFGCGGDRDKGKRPLMGRIAEQQADVVVITNDNSRSEDPQQIARDILTGLEKPEKAQVELDRRVAIKQAMGHAKPGDILLLAGKGHENYQIIGDNKINYDEREYANELIKGTIR
ncbi:UDP-N-acetylmuramoyl-L-alanyl-D-glutamate--2,6-diaminopimelate ligase [Bowmanella dokdonensis]|uniref:UDP-N-acetylmuramyl-tripeptide synthetase n=1 Tax=Bowmanella dokdonensis TaxID=751969 RepID=A0A939DKD3_9ALTE|nr:UDP-N-acetylmuramoyl-L-alanyl-D-glutamate--2,6-diaminopimelate ligase [Bowmanella dokdonensis]MBN7824093.1 UDP-N-acetylmuramoyl-L-alanyl-D-glutamate--2,6-diaminopimelate ligase [Bowmanella dokdonensis]